MKNPSDSIATTLDVIIVTYNSESYIGNCLRSLLEHDGELVRMSVYVVDNASRDRTTATIRADFPTINVLENKSNEGFAKANNRVLRNINSEYTLLLNPDTEVNPATITHLIGRLESDDSIGMIGCRLVRRDGSFDHASKRSLPTPKSSLKYTLTKFGFKVRSDYTAPEIDELATAVTGAINGAFMLCRSSAIKQVGQLDERYWMYAEDLDWCRRFQQAGWKVIYDGTVTSIHLKGAASGTHRRLRLNWYFHHSMAQYYTKFDAGQNYTLDGIVLIGIYARFLFSSIGSVIVRLSKRELSSANKTF